MMRVTKVYLLRFVVLLGALFVMSANAAPMKVLNFNVMCDFCKGKQQFGKFRERIPSLVDTVNRHDPDLISFQEFRSKAQLKKIMRQLKSEYIAIYAKGWPMNYPDATLLARKSRFRVLAHQGGWLGPKWPEFSMGWKTGIPRRVQFATLEDSSDGTRFVFVGSHFDNHGQNKEESAELLVKLLSEERLPILFAGDTNLSVSMRGYTTLSTFFRDTFHEVEEPVFFKNSPAEALHVCSGRSVPRENRFPDCRIDHVLLSRNAPWKVRQWGVDLYRYRGLKSFASDHRAVLVELE